MKEGRFEITLFGLAAVCDPPGLFSGSDDGSGGQTREPLAGLGWAGQGSVGDLASGAKGAADVSFTRSFN